MASMKAVFGSDMVIPSSMPEAAQASSPNVVDLTVDDDDDQHDGNNEILATATVATSQPQSPRESQSNEHEILATGTIAASPSTRPSSLSPPVHSPTVASLAVVPATPLNASDQDASPQAARKIEPYQNESTPPASLAVNRGKKRSPDDDEVSEIEEALDVVPASDNVPNTDRNETLPEEIESASDFSRTVATSDAIANSLPSVPVPIIDISISSPDLRCPLCGLNAFSRDVLQVHIYECRSTRNALQSKATQERAMAPLLPAKRARKIVPLELPNNARAPVPAASVSSAPDVVDLSTPSQRVYFAGDRVFSGSDGRDLETAAVHYDGIGSLHIDDAAMFRHDL
jgi:hypothetical protein